MLTSKCFALRRAARWRVFVKFKKSSSFSLMTLLFSFFVLDYFHCFHIAVGFSYDYYLLLLLLLPVSVSACAVLEGTESGRERKTEEKEKKRRDT